MEIDLNHALSEEEIACGGGGGGGGSGGLVASSTSSLHSSVYYMLWHACAGPLTKLPKKGSLVVYFPQGHLEQIASSASSPLQSLNLPTFNLQPQIFCKVINVQLLANKENDEVYTRVTLLPQPELGKENWEEKEHEEVRSEEEGADGVSPINSTPHMFCKTLTASDTSTHGGFSVPRRAAEDCFPPLDYKQQRPSQELVAKDLHGAEWRFRHIYRGQPRRHLLTTGWANFISQKNLASGDAVLFLRGEDGELRLGIRRACQAKNIIPNLIPGNQGMHLNVLSLVANAVSTKSMFHVFYSPRGNQSEYVIPIKKYMKSIINPISIGMRFNMNFEMEDRAEKRCSGIITGIGDLDPYRYPNSKWRCLTVRWYEDLASNHQERISPWEIETTTSMASLSMPSAPRLKKTRTTSPDNPVGGGRGLFMDFNEPIRSSKVLQGQEIFRFSSPHYGGDRTINSPFPCEKQNPVHRSLAASRLNDSVISDLMQSQTPNYKGVEPARFEKVLQGQEIFPLRSLHGEVNFNPIAWGNSGGLGCNMFNMYQRPDSKFSPLTSRNIGTIHMPFHDQYKANMTSFQRERGQSDLSSIQRFPGALRGEVCNPVVDNRSAPASLNTNVQNHGCNELDGTKTGCKLFGFSLTGQVPISPSSRSCTKVHKQGNLVGRAIDLSKLNGYGDLLDELEHLFNMEGLLRNPEKGWQVVYTDSENDMMVVGDDPWNEFCNIVSKIHIYTLEEVEKMTIGVASDDTQSCLEEALQ